MSTQSSPDGGTEEWVDRFTGIKSEMVFEAGTGRRRCIVWNEIQAGEGTTEWIKLDHSALVTVRR